MSGSARSARVTCMTGVEGAASGAGAFVGDATEAQTPAEVQSPTGMPHGQSPGCPPMGPRARVASCPDGTATATWGRSASTDIAVGPQQSIGRVAASADAAEPSSICSASREASRARQPRCRSSSGRCRRERLNMEGNLRGREGGFQIVSTIASSVSPQPPRTKWGRSVQSRPRRKCPRPAWPRLLEVCRSWLGWGPERRLGPISGRPRDPRGDPGPAPPPSPGPGSGRT